MTILEMHILFRQLAQQMGLQNVRAILPEQIDLLLNTAIIDTVNQIVRRNVLESTIDKVIRDNSKIGEINGLSTLIKNTEYSVEGTEQGKYGYTVINHKLDSDTSIMFYLSFAVNYTDDKYDGLYPVRIIDSSELTKTLNDFILKPNPKSPIGCYLGRSDNNQIDDGFDFYIGKMNDDILPRVSNLIITTISYPVKVSSKGTQVHCNLPEYLHNDIVKAAVNLQLQSIQSSQYARLNQEQHKQSLINQNQQVQQQ